MTVFRAATLGTFFRFSRGSKRVKFSMGNSSRVAISFSFIKFNLRITVLGLALGLGLGIGFSLVCNDN